MNNTAPITENTLTSTQKLLNYTDRTFNMFVIKEDPNKIREAERREYFRVTKKRTDNFDFKTESGIDAIGCQLISSNT